MNTILLDADQIIDLIFEKKLRCDDTNISTVDSGLAILSKLEERIENGKMFRGSNSCLQRRPYSESVRSR